MLLSTQNKCIIIGFLLSEHLQWNHSKVLHRMFTIKCHGDTEEHKSDYINEPTMQQAFVILKERNMTHIYLRLEYHVLHFIYTDYIFY